MRILRDKGKMIWMDGTDDMVGFGEIQRAF